MGKRKGRDISGWLIVDKPAGITSTAVVNKVRWALDAKKAGHAGTLDPEATGVLAVALGEATKTVPFVTDSLKAYAFMVKLGEATNTDDAEGEVIARSDTRPSDDAIKAALGAFVGDIMQVPPVYSALKQGGEPMYLKARRGDVIDLPARPVRIHDIELLTLEPAQFSLRVTCGSGTYIRSLIRDLGEALGCGAHVTALHRLWVEPFQALPLRTLDGLQALAEQGLPELDAVLHPVAEALVAVPRLVLDDDQARRVGMGQKIRIPEPFAASERVQLCNVAGLPLGLAGISADGHLTVQRLFRWAAIN